MHQTLSHMRGQLLQLISQFRQVDGRSEATISNHAVGHARLFSRVRGGKGLVPNTYDRAIQWFSDNWPADLPWPADIPRPACTKQEDAA